MAFHWKIDVFSRPEKFVLWVFVTQNAKSLEINWPTFIYYQRKAFCIILGSLSFMAKSCQSKGWQGGNWTPIPKKCVATLILDNPPEEFFLGLSIHYFISGFLSPFDKLDQTSAFLWCKLEIKGNYNSSFVNIRHLMFILLYWNKISKYLVVFCWFLAENMGLFKRAILFHTDRQCTAI